MAGALDVRAVNDKGEDGGCEGKAMWRAPLEVVVRSLKDGRDFERECEGSRRLNDASIGLSNKTRIVSDHTIGIIEI